jgi:hypothetical protein
MLIRIKKIDDGVVMACLRDGHEAEVQRTRHGGFFALHDLLHYSVETVLGFDQAFLGLMASGWSFENFTRHDDPPPSSAAGTGFHCRTSGGRSFPAHT